MHASQSQNKHKFDLKIAKTRFKKLFSVRKKWMDPISNIEISTQQSIKTFERENIFVSIEPIEVTVMIRSVNINKTNVFASNEQRK